MGFKVGDKVVPIEELSEYGFPKGEVVEVVNVYAHGTIRIRNKSGREETFFGSRLQLAKSEPTKNQRITTLEETVAKQGEEISELKLIVEQLRKSNITIQEVEAHFGVESPMLTVEGVTVNISPIKNIIEFEDKQYRKVDREAREGDVFIIARDNGDLPGWFTVGKPYKALAPSRLSSGVRVIADDNDELCVYHTGCGRTPETVDVYEPITQDVQRQTVECESQLPFDDVEDLPYEPTPNELRAEIIEKAKGFIEDAKTTITGEAANGTNKGEFITLKNVYSVREIGIRKTACNAEFIVNEEKRTIVALLRGIETNKVYHRGIAKCMPGDVFNSHIGKAIALGRALGLDVSEFEQAVQPNKPVIGMVVERMHHSKVSTLGRISIEEIRPFEGESNHLYPHNEFVINKYENFGFGNGDKIINDTNAIYGGVE